MNNDAQEVSNLIIKDYAARVGASLGCTTDNEANAFVSDRESVLKSLFSNAVVFLRAHLSLADEESLLMDGKLPENYLMVLIYLVKDAWDGGTSAGASSVTQTAGPYSQTLSYDSPVGSMYWRKQYDDLLGLSGVTIASIRADHHAE